MMMVEGVSAYCHRRCDFSVSFFYFYFTILPIPSIYISNSFLPDNSFRIELKKDFPTNQITIRESIVLSLDILCLQNECIINAKPI